MAVIKRNSSLGSFNADLVSTIKDAIKKHASNYFSGTLGNEKDIVNIITAQYYLESRFNVNSLGPNLTNKESRDYLSCSAIKKVLETGSSTEKANVDQGLRVIGLGQVSAHYLIKKGSPSGTGEIERIRPDLASQVCVNAGEDLFSSHLGIDNISKQVLASMIILEDKWNNIVSIQGYYFKHRRDHNNNRFPTRIGAAIAAYLGLGQMDSNGTTPLAYSNSIVGGSIYATANGANPIIYQSSNKSASLIASGPSTNGSTKSKISPAGCG